ncbi:DUF4913 domain-containing protein [Agromyces sp. GXS1127]|uniref:DUF4913 domain-containing protein n=1 Tax=Agromyces sp. GXS1127 TaxID=3424181 RepID=UPI003D3221EB
MSIAEWDENETTELEQHVVDIDEQPITHDPAVDEEMPQTYYGSVDEFVREKIVTSYRRLVGPQAPYRWAADWWSYPEAVSRLDALWRAWEHLRLDGVTGASVWWRDHADHHMRMLLDKDGPFMTSKDMNDPGEPLPYTAPPEGLFPDVRAQAG